MFVMDLDMFFRILYIIFCLFHLLWIIYDIINFIIKKRTYHVVDATVIEPVRGRVQARDEPVTSCSVKILL